MNLEESLRGLAAYTEAIMRRVEKMDELDEELPQEVKQALNELASANAILKQYR